MEEDQQEEDHRMEEILEGVDQAEADQVEADQAEEDQEEEAHQAIQECHYRQYTWGHNIMEATNWWEICHSYLQEIG